MESHELISSALKEGLHMVDDLVDHFYEPECFLGRCLQVQHKMMAVVARRCMRKKAEQFNIASFVTVFCLLLCHALPIVQSLMACKQEQ